ncbi:hypothetical protein Q5752_006320 [Cryptotrichosporon argae]
MPEAKILERLSDTMKLSAHVTRLLGQNPGQMTLQGTNSYLLQPPSNALAPIILIDTSSPHTATQYTDLLINHLHHLGLESGVREVHFESRYAERSLKHVDAEQHAAVKARIVGERRADPHADPTELVEYGPGATWAPNATKERRLPPIEHIILTHRHLDHVGALPHLLTTLKEHGLPPPKLWKYPSPDEVALAASERDRPTSDAKLWESLVPGTYTAFGPLQPFHPISPGLMISIIDPQYRHLLKHDADGKPKWADVPEVARVSVRCLRTPGHTADSVSLVLTEGDKGVFTGDTVLGQGTAVFTDLTSYMISLKTLLALKPQVLYPAHGPAIIGPDAARAHISDYMAHRQAREDELVGMLSALHASPGSLGHRLESLRALKAKEREAAKQKEDDFYQWSDRKKRQLEAATVPEPEVLPVNPALFPQPGDRDDKAVTVPLLVRLVYQSDNEKLIAAAGKSVSAHLVKLEKDGTARRSVVRMPKIVDNVVTEPLEQEAWEFVPKVEA